MKLTEYLDTNSVSRTDFAKQVGVTVEAVRLWERGERFPRPGAMKAIINLTGGNVGWEDFDAEAA